MLRELKESIIELFGKFEEPPTADEMEVEIARSGEFESSSGNKVKFDAGLMKALAANHDSNEFLAVNKIGHPSPEKTETPAYGPVTGLRYDEGKDRLMAKIKPTSDLRLAIHEGRFPNRSLEFTKNFRGSGKPKLLGIGWLGATPPAIHGLSPAQFAALPDDAISVLAFTGDSVELFRDFTAEQRKKLAKDGAAMPDGSFPISTEQDLENAMHAIGRASDPSAAKAHIKKRAKALGLTAKLGPAFGGDKEDASNGGKDEKSEMSAPMPGRNDVEVDMAEQEALAESQARIKQLESRLKDSSKDSVKAWMLANKAKIPMAMIKAGIEDKLTALMARDAASDETLTFSLDGQEQKEAVSKVVMDLFAALPDQLSTDEKGEKAKDGADAIEAGTHVEGDPIEKYSNVVKFAESEIHQEVRNFMAANPTFKGGYAAAFEIVTEGHVGKGAK